MGLFLKILFQILFVVLKLFCVAFIRGVFFALHVLDGVGERVSELSSYLNQASNWMVCLWCVLDV